VLPGWQPAGVARSQRYGPPRRSPCSAARTSRPDTLRPTRWRRSSTGSRRRRAAARCSGCARATERSCARCWRSRARTPPATAAARGLGWREDETNASSTFARSRVRAHSSRRCGRSTRRPSRTCWRRRVAARRATVARRRRRRRARRWRHDPLTTLGELPVALARLVVQRLADRAAGRPAPGSARRLGEILALGVHGSAALDLPHGVRAQVQGGVLRFVRTPGAPAAGPRHHRGAERPLNTLELT